MKNSYPTRSEAVAKQFAFRRMGFPSTAYGKVLSVTVPEDSIDFMGVFGDFTLA